MAGQLGAFIALGSAALASAPYTTPRGRGVHAAVAPLVFNPLGPSRLLPISWASLSYASARGGCLQQPVTHSRRERPLGSSFFSTSAFNREAWVRDGRDRSWEEEKRRKGCGLARAAGGAGKDIRKSVSGGVQVFTQVTFPNIRLGILYGVTLCNARAMGEFGDVSVISGNIVGKTQTLTLFVESAYKEYNTQGAFSAALLLSVLALFTLVVKTKLEDERAKQLSFR